MQNRYVFNPFWQHHNGIDGHEDWEERFKASAGAFAGPSPRRISSKTERLQRVDGGGSCTGR